MVACSGTALNQRRVVIAVALAGSGYLQTDTKELASRGSAASQHVVQFIDHQNSCAHTAQHAQGKLFQFVLARRRSGARHGSADMRKQGGVEGLCG